MKEILSEILTHAEAFATAYPWPTVAIAAAILASLILGVFRLFRILIESRIQKWVERNKKSHLTIRYLLRLPSPKVIGIHLKGGALTEHEIEDLLAALKRPATVERTPDKGYLFRFDVLGTPTKRV